MAGKMIKIDLFRPKMARNHIYDSESRFLTQKWPKMTVFTPKYDIFRNTPCSRTRRFAFFEERSIGWLCRFLIFRGPSELKRFQGFEIEWCLSLRRSFGNLTIVRSFRSCWFWVRNGGFCRKIKKIWKSTKIKNPWKI